MNKMKHVVLALFFIGGSFLNGFAQESITLQKKGKDKTKSLTVKRIVGIETKDQFGMLEGEVVSIDASNIEFKYKVIVDSIEVDFPHRKDKFYYSEVYEDTVVKFSYDQLNAIYYSKVKNKKSFESAQKVVNYVFIGTLGLAVVSFSTGQKDLGTVAVGGVGLSGLCFLYMTLKDTPKKYKLDSWEVK